jgi:hypothetical protein
MKRILLISAAMALASGTVSAQTPDRVAAAARPQRAVTVKDVAPQVLESRTLSGNIKMHTVKSGEMVYKRIVGLKGNRVIQPRRATRAEAGSGYVLNEDFEGCTGKGWMPEGWQAVSKDATTQAPWIIDEASAIMLMGAQGSYLAICNFNSDFINEWLITPTVHVEDGMVLRYLIDKEPLWMYSTDNVDWDTYTYIGEKTQVYTIKVNISEDGGNTWTTVDDFAKRPEFLAMDFEEAMNYDGSLAPETLDLSAYAGKDIKIGFEYVGTDGQVQGIDCVSVGYPELNAAYWYPFETLCFGTDPNFVQWTLDVAMLPVYSPITWTNASEGNPDNTSYTWSYMAADNSQLTSTDEELTETYRTDYTSEFTTRNNMYTAPVLTATADKSAPGEYSLYKYFQTGGKPEVSLKDEKGNAALYNLGLTTFATSEGLSLCTGGDDSSPIFGYDANLDKFWTDYTFQGDNGENDYVHLTGILNTIYTGAAPMVIDGGWVLAKGHGIKADHEFKLEIIPLSDEGEMTQPVATATCKGSDIQVIEGGGLQDYLTLKFRFALPVVMSQEVCDSYVVRLSGMHDCGEYFAPYQSVDGNPNGFAFGWIEKDICFEGEVRSSLSPVVNYTGATQSFAIMLDGYYPWLQPAAQEVQIDSTGSAALELDTYHPVTDLTVEGAPEWLTYTFEGTRYNDARIKFQATNPEEATCSLTIKGLGINKQIKISSSAQSGIHGIEVDGSGSETVYTLGGVKVNGQPAPGIYVVKDANGRVAKKVIK